MGVGLVDFFFSLLWAVVVVVGVADGRVGLFCSAVLAVVVPCFVVLWFFFFFSLLWIAGGGGGGGGCCGFGCG